MVSVSDLLGSIRKAEQHAENACVYKMSLQLPQYQCCRRQCSVRKTGSQGYKLQNCSGHCRTSSFLKDPQCVAVRTGEHGDKTAAVLPLTQRVDRLPNCYIFLSSDEPCWQSCAARGDWCSLLRPCPPLPPRHPPPVWLLLGLVVRSCSCLVTFCLFASLLGLVCPSLLVYPPLLSLRYERMELRVECTNIVDLFV